MLLRFLTLIFFVSCVIYHYHIPLRPEDIIAYERLVQESTELRTKRALEEKPAQQQRQGVRKDIWSHDEITHLQIESEHSELILTQKKDKTEIIEELQKIRCAVENDFTLTADEGIYAYPSHQFIAQKNCHLTQNENHIDGTRIHLDLASEIVTYENPKGTCGTLNFTAKQLIWKKKEGKLYLTDHVTIDQPDQFTLLADEGVLTLNQLHPAELILKGNVRLLSSRIQDKNSYAIADTLIYDPILKTLLFTADKKVLFWQEGLSLSANQIFIRSDQTVEGRGDVHFTFDLEEQNFIDKLFKQYL
jgi:lipopolysaccharide export system protein LptA